MKAVTLRRHGGPEVLELEDLPEPQAGPGQVRVHIARVAVNHVDIWVRKGMPHLKLHYPHLLGADIAGTLDQVGEGVTGLKVGDEIVVNPGHSCMRCRECLSGRDNLCRHYKLLGEDVPGGYAEKIVLPQVNVALRPREIGVDQAAAAPVVYMTAWQMLVRKARLEPGQDVLVMGAGSGVGTAAIQIAKLFGARVIAAASSQEKLDRARALGADDVLLTDHPEFVREVKRLTNKRGADVVFEHVGKATWSNSILSAAWGGRVVTCGATTGFMAETDLRQIFFRQVEILGSTMSPKGDLYRILTHMAAGRLKPVVDRVLPLEQAAEAHRLIEARAVFGKVVLKP